MAKTHVSCGQIRVILTKKLARLIGKSIPSFGIAKGIPKMSSNSVSVRRYKDLSFGSRNSSGLLNLRLCAIVFRRICLYGSDAESNLILSYETRHGARRHSNSPNTLSWTIIPPSFFNNPTLHFTLRPSENTFSNLLFFLS